MKGQIIRLGAFIVIGGIVSLGLNAMNYKRYWQRTIHDVQTVDFNLLSHSLPVKLSALLIKGDSSEIQRTVNSNYGLFKIVITNCSQNTVNCLNQKILYLSEADKNNEITIKDLENQPFNLLRDPIPLQTEWKFDSPNATEPTLLPANNQGKIIGRVYYLRNKPPTFIADLTRHLTNFPANGFLNIYIVTLGLSITSSLLMWLLSEQIIRSYQYRQQALEDKKETEKDLANIRNQYTNSINKKEAVIKDYQKQLEESKKLHQQLTVKRLELEQHKQSLSQAQELLKNREIDAKIQQKELELELTNIQAELDSVSVSEESAKMENERLTQELDNRELEKEQLNNQLIELDQKIDNLKRSSSRKIKEAVQAAVEQVHQKYEEYFDEIAKENQELEEEIEQLLSTQDYYEKEINKLKAKIRHWKYQANQNSDTSETNNDEDKYIDMSPYKFAIVSGHQNTVQNIQTSLIETNHVNPNNITWIKDKKLGHNIRSKISHVDFVIVLTDYGGHQETRDAINLTKAGSIDAHLIMIPKGWHNGERIRQFIEEEVITVN
ncbi:MAG: hypothetical protein AB4041_10975 [Microcystaceae cyanobacterium]